MPLLPQPELEASFRPYALLRQRFGFVPEVFRAQSLLPRLIEAEVPIFLLTMAADRIDGSAEQQKLEAIQMAASARFFGTLATALDVAADFDPRPVQELGDRERGSILEGDSATSATFEFFEEQFGFVPNLYRAQTLRPDVLQAQAFALAQVLITSDLLSRIQKEYILLAVSAANRNTYCVTLHGEVLRTLGVPQDAPEQIAIDYRASDLPAADKALLDFAVAITRDQAPRAANLDAMRRHGFGDRHLVEAVAVASLTNFLNTLQAGLGTVPDFTPRCELAPVARPELATLDDPDATLVASAVEGDSAAFEELVRRHHRRLCRAALCVTGNREDAEDAAQVAFVKAFQNLRTFERHARFSTWLTRIAINEAVARVRARKPFENLSLDDDSHEFRPALLDAWVDDPERLYAREELRSLIENAMAGMPVRFRMAVLLRDIEQLSTTEAAAALGVPAPTLKKHLARGRLMLREALAPHFVSGQGMVARV